MDGNYREGQLIIYRKGAEIQIGKIKRIVGDGAFVFYHSGETAAKTPFEHMSPISNDCCIEKTNLGGTE